MVSLDYVSVRDEQLIWQLDLPETADGEVDSTSIQNAVQTPDDDMRISMVTTVSVSDLLSLGELKSSLISNVSHLRGRRINVDAGKTSFRVHLADGSEKVFRGGDGPPVPQQSGVNQEGVRAKIVVDFATTGPIIQQLDITVITLRASRNLGEILEESRKLGDVNTEQGSASIELSTEAQSIIIKMQYTPADIGNDKASLTAALGRSGWLIYRAAQENCIGINHPEPSDAVRRKFVEKAEGDLALPNGQNTCRVSISPQQPGTDKPLGYLLVADHLRLVSDVKPVSLPYPWEDDGFKNREGKAAELIATKRILRFQEVIQQYQGKVDEAKKLRVGTAAGWKNIEDLRVTISHDSDVFSVKQPEVVPDGDDMVIKLPVVIRDPEVLTLSAGGSYSPENGATADLAVTGKNYLHQWANFSGKIKLGNQLQSGTASGNIVQPIGGNFQAMYSLEGRLYRNTGQLLGNDKLGSIEDRETGILPKVGMRYDSSSRTEVDQALVASSAPSSVSRVRASVDAAFDYRYVDLKGRGLESQVTGNTLSAIPISGTIFFTDVLGKGPNPFFKSIEVALSTTTEQGLRNLGGQYSYEQYGVTASLTVFAGFTPNRNDFFARYRQGGGVSSGGTPIFKQFRLGGVETLPGMESGEVVTNNYGFRQIDLGISLVRLLGGKADANKYLPGNAYLKITYASAATSTKHDYDRLLGAGPELQGCGIGLEVRSEDKTKALTVGYGYSPDSKHRSGIVMAGAIIFF
jgi:hypothetical protein